MKRTRLLLGLVIACFAMLVTAQDQTSTRPELTTKQISAATVIGKLGLPLGECFDIDAIVVKGENSKGDHGRYFLKVTHVQGRELVSAVRCDFHVHQFATERVKIAGENFRLQELRTGKRAGSLSSEQIADLEKGYVGTTVRLTVYETGGFRGRPKNIPGDGLPWADFGFGFASYLFVMDQR